GCVSRPLKMTSFCLPWNRNRYSVRSVVNGLNSTLATSIIQGCGRNTARPCTRSHLQMQQHLVASPEIKENVAGLERVYLLMRKSRRGRSGAYPYRLIAVASARVKTLDILKREQGVQLRPRGPFPPPHALPVALLVPQINGKYIWRNICCSSLMKF